MSERFDVIVIGAGPAGSRISSAVSRRGYSVLLLEKRPRIGYPVRCAEAIGPSSLTSRLFEVKDSFVSSTVEGVTVVSPAGRVFSADMPGVGHILDREKFDTWLAEEAAANGAELRTGQQAVSLIIKDGSVRGTRVLDIGSGSQYDVSALVTVGADGVESLSTRWAGLKKAYAPGEVLSCAQHLVTGIDMSKKHIEFHLGSALAPGGYAWVFPKSPVSANVGVGIDPALSGGKTAIEFLEAFLLKRCPEAEKGRLVAGGSVVAKGLRSLSTGGFVAVGEAANQNNPFTGGGILNAILGADCAAGTVLKSLGSSDASASVLRQYTREWKKTAGAENETYYRIARIFYSLSDARMERIVSALAERPGLLRADGADPAGILKALFRADPRSTLKMLLSAGAGRIRDVLG